MQGWILALVVAVGVGYLITRPKGAFSVALRAGASVPATGFAMIAQKYMEAGWEGRLSEFDFVSVKIADGGGAYGGTEPAETLALARMSGCGLQGWGYHYLRDLDAGAREGGAAASIALARGVGAYWVNAEDHWLGIWKAEGTNPEDPFGAMAAFVAAFRAGAPGVELVFNGIAGAKLTNVIGDREAELASLFDLWGPMCYGTAAGTIAGKWQHGYGVAKAAGVGYAPMVGSGRYEAGVGYWGYTHDQNSGPGLLSVSADYPSDWVAFWVGTATEMLTESNDQNPQLGDVSKLLKTPGAIA